MDVSSRLRYEMAYNLYVVVGDPPKTWSMIAIAMTPALHGWTVVIDLTYLSFELYPYMVVRTPGSRARAPLSVLLLYALYGAVNTLLRTVSLLTWFWLRFATGAM